MYLGIYTHTMYNYNYIFRAAGAARADRRGGHGARRRGRRVAPPGEEGERGHIYIYIYIYIYMYI